MLPRQPRANTQCDLKGQMLCRVAARKDVRLNAVVVLVQHPYKRAMGWLFILYLHPFFYFLTIAIVSLRPCPPSKAFMPSISNASNAPACRDLPFEHHQTSNQHSQSASWPFKFNNSSLLGQNNVQDGAPWCQAHQAIFVTVGLLELEVLLSSCCYHAPALHFGTYVSLNSICTDLLSTYI